MEIKGIDRNTSIVIDTDGSKNSPTEYRFDLIPPLALFSIAENLMKGAAKYGEHNWEKAGAEGIEKNINKATIHLYAFLSGDRSDDHLCHAATRLMFALKFFIDEEAKEEHK